MKSYKKALALLTPRERRQGGLLLVMVTIMAFLEAAGVASILPFLSVLGNPETIQANPLLNRLFLDLGFQSVEAFLVALGVFAFAMVLLAAIFRIVTKYAMDRYTHMRRHSIGERLLEVYLRQPYAFFLNRHSGDLAKSILSEVDQLVGNVFKPGLDIVAHAFVALALVALLFMADPWLALGASVVIGGLYLIIFSTVKGRLVQLGQERAAANRQRFKAAGEAISGIKDIKLLGKEAAYVSRFRPSSVRFARHQATNETVSQVPKYLIEAIGVGGIVAIALILIATGGGMSEVLPVLGLYAFAGYRLLPAAQHIYGGLAKLRFGVGAIDVVYEDLDQKSSLAEIHGEAPEALRPRHRIEFCDVTFAYPYARGPAVRNITLSIPVGTSTGLVGTTGAGKTTLVDLLLGLLAPSSGTVLVDETPITDRNVRAWQRAIGYVPQEIFLTDTTVAENIALGVPLTDIDREAVERCARLAQVDQFILTELPEGYDTEVGERGVRLSGGERQRIGIARALYHDPDVLVFDEATSALDNVTERAVMDALRSVGRRKTVVIIAHRLSTVQGCDNIVLLEHGEVKVTGSFAELIQDNESFRTLAAGTG